MDYPRAITKDFQAFDPIEVGKETEKRVILGEKRKYNLFRIERFYGQIATARAVGCNLRCAPCWISPSRDFPEDYGQFYSPEEAYDAVLKASKGFGDCLMSELVRISGCEPTIGREHLLSFIRLCKQKGDFRGFLLETNGILLGNDESYVDALSEFGKYLTVRLSFKAGTPEGFEKRTGAQARFFGLPFKALRFLKEKGIQYRLAAMSQDPSIMPSDERRGLLKRLIYHGPENLGLLEEEQMDGFGITLERLSQSGANLARFRQRRYAGFDLKEARDAAKKAGLNCSLVQLVDISLFQTVEMPCAGCKRKNVWHGHGVRDDLDKKLG